MDWVLSTAKLKKVADDRIAFINGNLAFILIRSLGEPLDKS